LVDTRKLTKREAGAIGARKRWGDQPRIVRLDSLTSEQRRLVLALVEAAKSRPDPAPEAA
jgi:hypothetical protein